MSDDRREETAQKLEQAIHEYMDARGHGEGLLIDWLLVSAQHVVDDDGSGTGVAIYTRQEGRAYTALGLAEYASTRIRDGLNRP